MEEMFKEKNVVNNVDKSSLWAPWQNGPYKSTQNTEYTKTQQTLKITFLGFFSVAYKACFSVLSVYNEVGLHRNS